MSERVTNKRPTAERLPVEELAKHLSYNADTGGLTWLISTCNRVKAGDAAGTAHREGYVMVALHGVGVGAHRIAWALHYGEWPSGPVDHINRDPADNRIENLRVVTPSQNSLNRGVQRNNKLGLKGVIADQRRGGYRAALTIEGVREELGTFPTPEEAAESYREALARAGFAP